jgi:heat shock factor-binding protein 1
LEQLDAKFDDMSTQILERSKWHHARTNLESLPIVTLLIGPVNQMSTRVDALEASIQDIINGDVSVPQSPSPGTPGGIRRSDSALQ